MSLARLIWMVVTGAYLVAGALALTLLVPPMVTGIETGLHAQSLTRAQALETAWTAQAAEPDSAATLAPQTLQQWQALAQQEGWSRLVVLDPRGERLALHERPQAGWSGAITRRWDGGHAAVPLNSAGQRQGTLLLLVNTQPAEEQVEQVLLLWGALFAASGALILLGLHRMQRWAQAPLRSLCEQVEALSEQRFLSVPQPKVAEWIDLSRALNVLAARVRLMLDERDHAIHDLMDRLKSDDVTGAASREYFMASLRNHLRDQAAGGGMAIIRVHNLEGMNRRLGRNRTDEFLKAVATAVRARMLAANSGQEHVLARLNGADFGLLLPGADLPSWRALCSQLSDNLRQLADEGMTDRMRVAWIGGTTFARGEVLSDVLLRADSMVMRSEHEQLDSCVTEPKARRHMVTIAQWRSVIELALETGHLALQCHPVLLANGELLHKEAELRLIRSSGTVVAARYFVPPAIRCGRIADLDLKGVQLALSELERDPELQISVNVAAQSLLRPIFQRQVVALLQGQRSVAARLWLEMRDPEVLGHSAPALHKLCEVASQSGCRVGLDHFGVSLSLMPLLQHAALRYVKLAPRVTAQAASDVTAASYVKLLTKLATHHGVQVVACDVQTPTEMRKLASLGVHAFTGPGVEATAAVPA